MSTRPRRAAAQAFNEFLLNSRAQGEPIDSSDESASSLAMEQSLSAETSEPLADDQSENTEGQVMAYESEGSELASYGNNSSEDEEDESIEGSDHGKGRLGRSRIEDDAGNNAVSDDEMDDQEFEVIQRQGEEPIEEQDNEADSVDTAIKDIKHAAHTLKAPKVVPGLAGGTNQLARASTPIDTSAPSTALSSTAKRARAKQSKSVLSTQEKQAVRYEKTQNAGTVGVGDDVMRDIREKYEKLKESGKEPAVGDMRKDLALIHNKPLREYGTGYSKKQIKDMLYAVLGIPIAEKEKAPAKRSTAVVKGRAKKE